MQTAGNEWPITVELQDMMSYSKIGIIGLLVVVAIMIVTVVLFLVFKLRKNMPEPVVQIVSENKINHAKQKYNKLLMNLEYRYQNGRVGEKEAYQELSKYIRHFVYDVTGIRVQNYTLEEIGRINMPMLYQLIAECYAPEFSADATGDLAGSIKKAREVIYGWN